jgi:hypothetical protein
MSSKSFKKVESNTNVKPQLSKHINPNQINKSNGLYAKLRAIKNGDSEAVITYHFIEKKTFNDYGGDNNPKNKSFHTIEEKGREWKQVTPINTQCFYDTKSKAIPLDDVLALFVETTADLGATRFEI